MTKTCPRDAGAGALGGGRLEKIKHSLYRLFFTTPEAGRSRLSPRWQYLLPLLLFIATRLLIDAGYEYRQGSILGFDAEGYISTAQYLETHGHVPTEVCESSRVFPGLPLLMVVVDQLVHNTALAGLIIAWSAGLGSILLFHYLFREFRLTVIFTVFLPYWMATTSTIWSEGPTIFCFLVGVLAMVKLQTRQPLFWLCLLVAGYGIVLRQTMVWALIPFLAVYGWRHPELGWKKNGLILAVTLFPLLLYLEWNWITVHELFPQAASQAFYTYEMVDFRPNAAHYHRQLLDWPGYSVFAGLTDPRESGLKKGVVLTTIALVGAAAVLLVRAARAEKAEEISCLDWAFAVALLLFFLFHLGVGGTAGFCALDRYVAQLNPIMVYGLFYRRPLRWGWIALLGAAGLYFAVNIGPWPRIIF